MSIRTDMPFVASYFSFFQTYKVSIIYDSIVKFVIQ